MDVISLNELADKQLEQARTANSGRSGHTVYSGQENSLRQTLIALAAGHGLDEHESPGEATLQVLRGRVRLQAQHGSAELSAGEYILLPLERHSLDVLEDSVILLTVVPGTREAIG
ncbi:cupin domain-containing protein [Mycobacterium sp. SMC-4]|uniref:cupin domain-containing protein n=1 Tax=Mycobacterium sp. SMC-4 TaxID=2857059 RepID=UPI0021B28307|nr:cupin domain-containing protein [Mycobacterium sp. SMC-4]UXA20838.1 cupin domain-containing protein [Mycobacterium sp. SMC-4]